MYPIQRHLGSLIKGADLNVCGARMGIERRYVKLMYSCLLQNPRVKKMVLEEIVYFINAALAGLTESGHKSSLPISMSQVGTLSLNLTWYLQ